MPKHCAHGKCNSDDRYHPNKKFAKFPKLGGYHPDKKRCERWVHLCGRVGFSTQNVTHGTVVCEDHFEEGVDLDYRTVRNTKYYILTYIG